MAAAAEPRHRAQASLTLEGLDLGAGAADDAGFLRGGGAGAGAANGSGASGSGGSGAGPSTRPAPAATITVTDPVRRVGDSLVPGFTATHTEYLVAGVWGGAGGRRTEVRRRFKDFVVSGGVRVLLGGGLGWARWQGGGVVSAVLSSSRGERASTRHAAELCSCWWLMCAA